jgi:hypothetical protein
VKGKRARKKEVGECNVEMVTAKTNVNNFWIRKSGKKPLR